MLAGEEMSSCCFALSDIVTVSGFNLGLVWAAAWVLGDFLCSTLVEEEDDSMIIGVSWARLITFPPTKQINVGYFVSIGSKL